MNHLCTFPAQASDQNNHFDKFHDVNSRVRVAHEEVLSRVKIIASVLTVFFYFNERKGHYQENITKAALAELILHVETVSCSF